MLSARFLVEASDDYDEEPVRLLADDDIDAVRVAVYWMVETLLVLMAIIIVGQRALVEMIHLLRGLFEIRIINFCTLVMLS